MNKFRVLIAGGGTAGWMAATALSAKLGDILDISLVESDSIGTVGVGEATIPPLRTFHKVMGIDEREFMRATKATFKLGIEFENWGQLGDSYIHSFGRIGKTSWMADFHNFWLSAKARGLDFALGDFCFEYKAAKAGKFGFKPKADINYAYHLDASSYATFLRGLCEKRGLKRIAATIKQVRQHPGNGFIEALILDDGREVAADLFIDCTGFRGLLIEQCLHAGFEDWSHWLPCNSAVAVQTEAVDAALPYTRAVAHGAGWRWRIPLQHRVGNGLVYCDRYLDDELAVTQLLKDVDGEALTTPKVIKFKTGRRRKTWSKNCIALGLTSGFVEPLESTSIHLIMSGITRLIQMFPFDGVRPAMVDHFNALSRQEVEKIRDFIILHYKATQRNDSPFWRFCQDMDIPSSLAERMNLFAESAFVLQEEAELFRVDSWLQVMLGQGMYPAGFHPVARVMGDAELASLLGGVKRSIDQAVSAMPAHQQFVEDYCGESR